MGDARYDAQGNYYATEGEFLCTECYKFLFNECSYPTPDVWVKCGDYEGRALDCKNKNVFIRNRKDYPFSELKRKHDPRNARDYCNYG